MKAVRSTIILFLATTALQTHVGNARNASKENTRNAPAVQRGGNGGPSRFAAAPRPAFQAPPRPQANQAQNNNKAANRPGGQAQNNNKAANRPGGQAQNNRPSSARLNAQPQNNNPTFNRVGYQSQNTTPSSNQKGGQQKKNNKQSPKRQGSQSQSSTLPPNRQSIPTLNSNAGAGSLTPPQPNLPNTAPGSTLPEKPVQPGNSVQPSAVPSEAANQVLPPSPSSKTVSIVQAQSSGQGNSSTPRGTSSPVLTRTEVGSKAVKAPGEEKKSPYAAEINFLTTNGEAGVLTGQEGVFGVGAKGSANLIEAKQTATFENGNFVAKGGTEMTVGAKGEAAAGLFMDDFGPKGGGPKVGLRGSAEVGGEMKANGSVEDRAGGILVGAAGEANVAVGAKAEAEAMAGASGANAKAGAFAGDRFRASGTAKTGGFGLTGFAEGQAGAGAEAEAKAAYEDGKIKLGLSTGAALGVGGKLGVGMEVDVSEVEKTVKVTREFTENTVVPGVKDAGVQIGGAATTVGKGVTTAANTVGTGINTGVNQADRELNKAASTVESGFNQATSTIAGGFNDAAGGVKKVSSSFTGGVKSLFGF